MSSNFFANLSTRSFAPANMLQPKLPSLFEAPTGSEPLLEESSNTITHAETAEADPVSPMANRSRLENYSVRERERGIPPPAEPKPETPERQRVTRQTVLPFTPEEPQRGPIKTQSEAHVTVQTLRAEIAPEERKHETDRRQETILQSTGKNNKSESAQARAPRLVPVIPKLEQTHPMPQTNSADTKIFPVEDRSPTVHIHIGRIEVRAIMQPAPPAHPVHSNRPKLSLDDYLLRRNEGKR